MDEVKMDGKSLDITKMNIEALKELFPEVVEEDKIDFDKLKTILGDEIDIDNERYNFTWHGKNQAIRVSQTPSTGTLCPCKNKSIDWDNTQNIYIEGDNLEVLKLLQKSYFGKIKMIYIDPPYNTGNDFVYPDNYQDNIRNYLQITGQLDSDGNLISSNAETDGKYHTNWLNMMYPRLRLARNLMTQDGVIFISIDDNEVANLKKICDEIFGESNFEGIAHWRRRHNQPNDKTKLIGIVAEYVIVYSKNSRYLKETGVGKLDLTGDFSNPDNDPLGPWASKPWKTGSDQSGCRYTIVSPSGSVFEEEWMGDEDTYKSLLSKGRIYFPKNGSGLPRKKYYQFERESEGQCATNWWPHEQFGHNQGANDTLTSLFGVKNVFSNPKPLELVNNMIKLANLHENDIVLDFFSGSATTAHSLIIANIASKINRHFILVQIPHILSDKDVAYGLGFKTICDLAEERIRLVGSSYYDSLKTQQKTLDNIDKNLDKIDVGFRVFKLKESNIKIWSCSPEELQETLISFENNLVLSPGRSEEDLLYELIIKLGLPLSTDIIVHPFEQSSIYIIGSGALMVFFGNVSSTSISEEMIRLHNELEPEIWNVVFRDGGFISDSIKANTRETLKMAGLMDGCFKTL